MELKREAFRNEIERATIDDAFLEELVLVVQPGRQVQEMREMASQTLMVLAEDTPERIKQYCDLFYGNLAGKNAFSKMASILYHGAGIGGLGAPLFQAYQIVSGDAG